MNFHNTTTPPHQPPSEISLALTSKSLHTKLENLSSCVNKHDAWNKSFADVNQWLPPDKASEEKEINKSATVGPWPDLSIRKTMNSDFY